MLQHDILKSSGLCSLALEMYGVFLACTACVVITLAH